MSPPVQNGGRLGNSRIIVRLNEEQIILTPLPHYDPPPPPILRTTQAEVLVGALLPWITPSPSPPGAQTMEQQVDHFIQNCFAPHSRRD